MKKKRRAKFFESRQCAPVEAIHPTTRRIITVNYQKDAMIGYDIDEELARLPGLISWYLQLRNYAEKALKKAKHNELNTMEDLSIRIREAMEGKVTETQIKMHVNAHPKMRKAYRKRMKAEHRYNELQSAVEALIEKKWALRSIVDYRKVDNNSDSY